MSTLTTWLILCAAAAALLLVVGVLENLLGARAHRTPTEAELWQAFVDLSKRTDIWDQASQAANRKATRSVYLGVGVDDEFQQEHKYLPLSALAQHGIITGPPGSGKTSRVILPLCQQIAALTDGHPLVVIDLKGDPLLYHGVREAALSSRRTFKWVTLSATDPSYVFNFFSDDLFAAFSEQQIVEILLEAISLHYGEGYGQSFWTSASREVLWTALSQHARPRSFRELAETVTNILVERVHVRGHIPVGLRDALHLAVALNWLSEVAILNVDHPALAAEDRDQAITMSSVLENREVVYFWLPRMSASISAPSLAKAVVYSAVTAALSRQNRGAPKRQAFVFIDEAQHVVSAEIKAVLEQARSLGIGTMLACQSVEALNKDGTDMWPFVRDCTNVQLFLGCAGGVLGDYLTNQVGGNYTCLRPSVSEHMGAAGPQLGYSYSEEQRPRFDANTFAHLNAVPGLAVAYIKNVAQATSFSALPEYVQTFHSLAREQARELEARSWPAIHPHGGVRQMSLQRTLPPLSDAPPDEQLQSLVIAKQTRKQRKKK